jgi:hypothetical protein
VRRIARHRDVLSNRQPLRGHQNLQICRFGCVSAVTPLCFDVCHTCGRSFPAGCDVAHGLRRGQARHSHAARLSVRPASVQAPSALRPSPVQEASKRMRAEISHKALTDHCTVKVPAVEVGIPQSEGASSGNAGWWPSGSKRQRQCHRQRQQRHP